MNRLFPEKFLSAEEHGYYNLYNSRVKPRPTQPLLLGSSLFEQYRNAVEQRGNSDPEYEACSNALKRENWDLHLNKGLAKIMEVRRTHVTSSQWTILNRQVVEDLQLYIYMEYDEGSHVEVRETN